ncbi:MAG: ParB/RepB/Spo0J family partition protein [Oscillospiraceae bacterium]|nr:ParB/RepB/Spo0J family partition protein [Oscillospiraceae bacterium]
MTEKTTKTTSAADTADILLSAEKADKGITPTLKTKTTKIKEDNTMQNEKIISLPLNKLAAFENHPFQVKQDEDFQKLVDSIKENGILIPAVARPIGDGYELIAGHRRKFACQILGIEAMPVLVRELTNEQAVIAMVDSNVQRENILPSEKAFAYKMKLEAIKKQGKRTDLTSVPVGQKLARSVIAKENGESQSQIQRYVRLTELIPELLQLIDDGKIAFRPAVELSYLSKEQQTLLLLAMEAEQSTPSLSQAQKLKAMSAEGALTEDSMMEVMREPKANQKEQVRIPYDKIKAITKKDMLPKELEDFVLEAVKRYQSYLNRQAKDKGAR